MTEPKNDSGVAIESGHLLAVYERFKHLDLILRDCENADDPIYRTTAELWKSIVSANARPHAEVRSADSVHADVRSVFPRLGPWCTGCLQQGDGVCMIHSCVRYPPDTALRGDCPERENE